MKPINSGQALSNYREGVCFDYTVGAFIEPPDELGGARTVGLIRWILRKKIYGIYMLILTGMIVRSVLITRRLESNFLFPQTFIFLSNAPMYRDLTCSIARICFTGGNESITPRIAASAR